MLKLFKVLLFEFVSLFKYQIVYLTFLYISLKNVEYNALVNNYAVTFLFTAWSVCTVQCPSYSKAILTLGFGSIAAVRGLDKDFFF